LQVSPAVLKESHSSPRRVAGRRGLLHGSFCCLQAFALHIGATRWDLPRHQMGSADESCPAFCAGGSAHGTAGRDLCERQPGQRTGRARAAMPEPHGRSLRRLRPASCRFLSLNVLPGALDQNPSAASYTSRGRMRFFQYSWRDLQQGDGLRRLFQLVMAYLHHPSVERPPAAPPGHGAPRLLQLTGDHIGPVVHRRN